MLKALLRSAPNRVLDILSDTMIGRGLRGAVLFCETAPGIAAFACTNWEGVDTAGV